MKKNLLFIFAALLPLSAFPYNIRVDIDVTIMNGDGTINTGDDNESIEDRNESGSNREDSSDTRKDVSVENTS